MKPSFEYLTENINHSFAVRRVIREKRAHFSSAGVWHYHPGFEITLTTLSNGRRFVGYNYEEYTALDLVLIGENIPHCWITEEHTEQTVINFQKNFLGSDFLDKPELTELTNLLDKSKRGIKFSHKIIEEANEIIQKLASSQGLDRLINLLSLLKILAHDNDKRFLTSYNERTKGSKKMSSRIEKVYAFILVNYKNPTISQADLANELNMTSSSFCKFVKNTTRKTFYELVLEVRISHACRLLATSDKYVSEICFLSGFNNISNFNRIFKKIMHKSPLEYRKSYV